MKVKDFIKAREEYNKKIKEFDTPAKLLRTEIKSLRNQLYNKKTELEKLNKLKANIPEPNKKVFQDKIKQLLDIKIPSYGGMWFTIYKTTIKIGWYGKDWKSQIFTVPVDLFDENFQELLDEAKIESL